MNELDSIGIRFNTDKSSQARARGEGVLDGGRRGHDYLRKYDFFFKGMRKSPNLRMMELGIGPDWNMGASTKVWVQYFSAPGFVLHMVDINENARVFADADVRVTVGDLGDISFLEKLSCDSYDIIIDDASHFWGHQIEALVVLFNSVVDGGIYVIEDIHTSFGERRERYRKGAEVDAHTLLMALASFVAGDRRSHPSLNKALTPKLEQSVRLLSKSVESVTFIRHSCIICKQGYFS